MSRLIGAYLVLFLMGMLFGSLPFIGRLRNLPQWIRIALIMSGLSFVMGTAIGVVLLVTAGELSPQMYGYFYAHKMLVFGIGLGIILLLVFSGEYRRAMRALPEDRPSQS